MTNTEWDVVERLWGALGAHQTEDGTWMQCGKSEFVAALTTSQEPLRRALEKARDTMCKAWCGDGHCGPCCEATDAIDAAPNTGDNQ